MSFIAGKIGWQGEAIEKLGAFFGAESWENLVKQVLEISAISITEVNIRGFAG